MTNLTNNDYKKILEFYKLSIPKSKRLLKFKAEKIITSILCKCIKKVDKVNEARSIGICTKTVINNKGFTRGKFTCKKNKVLFLIKKQIQEKNDNYYIKIYK